MCKYKDRDFLFSEYVSKNKSVKEIASSFDVSPQAIHYWIKKHDISRRSNKLESREWMKQKYVDEGLSTVEIGNMIDEMPGTVGYWLKKHNIEVRSISESKKGTEFSKEHKEKLSEALTGKLTGKDHPNWNGGYDDYYGENWEEKRKECIENTPYCVNCGLKEDLVVHHIVYMRLFEKWEKPDKEDANKLSNLATLCRSCHSVLHAHPKGEMLINTEDAEST